MCSWEINPGNSHASRSDPPSAGCRAAAAALPSLPGPPPQPGRPRGRVTPMMGPLHRSHSDSSGRALQMQKHPLHPRSSSSLPALRRASRPEPGDEPARPSRGRRLPEPGARSASAAFPSARAGGSRSVNVSLQGSRLRCSTISCQLIQNLGLHAFAWHVCMPTGLNSTL